MANPSTAAKVPRDGRVLFFDNAGPGGSNTFGGPSETYVGAQVQEVSINAGAKPERIINRIRGKAYGSRKGDDPVIEITFQIPFYQWTNSAQAVLLDVLNGTGSINGSWTKDQATHEEWNTGVRLSHDGTAQSDSADHLWTARGVIWTYEWAENENALTVLNVTGEVPDYDNITVSGA